MKAMEMDIGNTHIEIWDDYVTNDPKKIQEILERVGAIGTKPKERKFGLMADKK